ncbi:MAG: iron-containing alcohol dehydrogenase [Clostridiales Family XIII bacterium]|jgi:alcohol dehydrogenase YqhD (iron-dependent ADH family)|nr:iron-containing alcohol dehydrogenase [Clostridiales Family XIII bacterium]
MLNFDYCAPTRFVFGKGSENEVGATLKPHASKALLHFGGSNIKKSGLYDRIVASLNAAGLAFVELGGVKPNPRVSLVREGIGLCKAEGVDLILAVGGGSVIDSSKAIAMGRYYEGDIWEVYEQGKPVSKALPVATVLTIPAAGSEASGASVISNEEKAMKLGYTSQVLRPLVSFVNPELFFTLPRNQIANGVSDMMSHVFERYFTNTPRTDLTDGLCEATLRAIMKNALILMDNPQDYDAWCEIGYSGTVAHIDMLGMGREEDWACHDIEHELSAIYDIAHGTGLAVLTPGWMRYVYRDNIPMFMQFAANVMDVRLSCRDPEALILEAISRLGYFFRKIGQPASLSELGIGSDQFEHMAKKATGIAYGKEERPVGGLKKLYWQDVAAIYALVK